MKSYENVARSGQQLNMLLCHAKSALCLGAHLGPEGSNLLELNSNNYPSSGVSRHQTRRQLHMFKAQKDDISVRAIALQACCLAKVEQGMLTT